VIRIGTTSWRQSIKGFFNLGFTNGTTSNGGERWDLNTAYGHWSGLKFMGSAGAWNDWSGTYRGSDNDPDYFNCIITQTETLNSLTACA
jgi:hypothetical protein